MNISAPFVRRPVATTLIAGGLLLLGLLSLSRLPIASLPNVERPTIVVDAYLPGASADTIATSLAQPLERKIGAISGIAEMTSYSANGGTEITIQFDLSKDVDGAAGDVLAAINAASPDLPRDLPRPPTYYKANPSGLSAIVLALTSETIPASELYELADSVVSAKLAALPGVAQVQVSGGERGAVRIRASARRLAAMKVSLEEVRQAVVGASRNLPKGTLASGESSWSIVADDQLLKAQDWQDVVVTVRNGAPVRLADIADVTDGVQNDRSAGWFGTERGVVIFVRKQPDANVVETVDAVKAELPELGKWLPPAVKIHTIYDRTTLIRASVADVGFAIEVAIGLIVVVIALFLRRVGATIVPILSIPAALAATLAGMDWLGYSLDNLSLMAIAIAVGFVVDDAVIVVEYVVRLVDEGHAPREAALAAARQMGFTIVAISATLIAALVPILFMPDIVGRYFREFGMTLAIAITASALVSLTLVPMLCSRLIRGGGGGHEAGPGRVLRAYGGSLAWCLRHPATVLLALALAFAGSVWSYIALPKGFMPTQDTGILRVQTVTNANVSFAAMERLQRRVAEGILEEPAVGALTSWVGGNGSTMSNGYLFIGLKPLGERPPIEAVIAALRARLAHVEGVRTFFSPQQDLNIGGQSSAARYQYTLVGPDLDALWTASEAMRKRMLAMAQITDVVTGAERSGLQAGLAVDRHRAAMFGVTPYAIDNTLYDAFGQRLVGMIYRPTTYSRVVLEVNPADAASPDAMRDIYVPGAGLDRPQVPLAEMMRPTRAHAPVWIRHVDQFPAITLSFDTRPGVAIGDAMAAIRTAEDELHFPDDVRGSFRGEAAEADKSGARQLLLFAGAIFAIYVVLGMLYESFAHPVTIISTLPSAVLGGLLALLVTGTQLTLVASIACILLVGMVMKNAILMVDFALDGQRRLGLTARDAILAAALARARPILMTTLVAALGAVPLAFGTGPGHELRQPLGIASIGGLLVAQFLTLYTTPVLFVLIDRLGRRTKAPDSKPAPIRRPRAPPPAWLGSRREGEAG